MNSEIGPSARQLLERAKAAQIRAPSDMKVRVKSSVLAAAATPSPHGSSKPPLRVLAKPWISATLLSLAGLGAFWGVSRSSSTDAVPSIAQAPTAPPDTSARALVSSSRSEAQGVTADDRAAEALPPTAANEKEPVQTRTKRGLSVRTSDLRAEMEWLARAEALLRKRDAAAALTELRTGRARFAHGQLQAERQGLELIARCMLGDDVRVTLARYIAGTPDGVLVDRARAACSGQSKRGP